MVLFKEKLFQKILEFLLNLAQKTCLSFKISFQFIFLNKIYFCNINNLNIYIIITII